MPWLEFGRLAWLLTLLASLGLFAAGIPVISEEMLTVCDGPACYRWQPTPEIVTELTQLGVPLGVYPVYKVGLEALFALSSCAIGTVLVVRRWAEPMALFAAFMLVTFGSATFTDTTRALASSGAVWWWPRSILACFGWASLFIFFYLFPSGRFVPRWTRFAAVATGALFALAYFSPPAWGFNSNDTGIEAASKAGRFFRPALVASFGSILVAQAYRHGRVSTPVQRQQAKWVVCGFVAAFGTFMVLFTLVLPALQGASPPVVGELLGLFLFDAVLLLIPLAIAMAILRHRLYDVDLLINRSLVYGALTACVVGGYVLIVGYLGALLRTSGNLPISLIATGCLALLFQPLRERLQHGVNRLMYGHRDEPYTALSHLGRRLEAALTPEAILPTVVESVASALRLPYAAIALDQGGHLDIAASYGRPSPEVLRLPLVYQSEAIGELNLSPRQPGEPLSDADRRLLEDLTRQVGVAAHAVRVTSELRASLHELRRSRERLVAAQENERQRIQRDLHDGLGPTLASMRLRLEACLELATVESTELVQELEQVHALVGEATADIRRLVHELRPPVLDQLGLVPALQQHIERFSRETALAVCLHADRALQLPAAAEVAAFRVAQEALLNVHKHARATRVDVRLEHRHQQVVLEVTDDGVGLAVDAARGGGGAGLRGMRDRADLLGGSLQVQSTSGGGTRLLLALPDGET